jgi:SAM-dependent methyltransferase
MDELPEIPAALREAAAALPRIYSDPAHYDVLAQMTAPDDLPFYRALVAEHGGPVLELGCGTGRVVLALAREGVETVGVELSAPMLAAARLRAEREGLGVTLALGDLRSFALDTTFALVLLPYNTLNHLHALDDLRRCFRTVRRHMDARSRFVVDTFQPSLAFLGGAPERARPILRYRDPYTAREVVLSEENHYDPATQRNRVVWRYATEGEADARVEEMTMRLFFPQELDALLELSGFAIERKLGDYDGRPFDSRSPKQLVVCRRA